MYQASHRVKNARRARRAMHGLGDTYNDESFCDSIPKASGYRVPGNYCATRDGGYTTFNADGTTVTYTPMPEPSVVDRIGGLLGMILGSRTGQPAQPTVPVSTGMSTGTMMMLAGGAVLAVVLISRR